MVAITFFKRHDDSMAKESQDDDDTMPSDFRSSLVKGEVALTKAVAENGKQFEFYTLDKTPVFFLENSRLYPTGEHFFSLLTNICSCEFHFQYIFPGWCLLRCLAFIRTRKLSKS